MPKIARCWNPKCGLTMRGLWRKGAPKNCPVCGWGQEEVQAMLKSQTKVEYRDPNEQELVEIEKKNTPAQQEKHNG